MRRLRLVRRARWLLAALAGGLVLLAGSACGDRDEPTDPFPTGEGPVVMAPACVELLGLLPGRDAELAQRHEELEQALAAGDEAEFETARADYLSLAAQTAQEIRELAATAADPQLQAVMERYADAFAGQAVMVAEQLQDDQAEPGELDTRDYEAAAVALEQACWS